VNAFASMEVNFIFPTHLILNTGLRYMTHNTTTDSINIPPITEEEVWSSFDFDYHSINVPMKVGYLLSLGDFIDFNPEIGIVLRFTGGHEYHESVNQSTALFSQEVPPAILYDYEKFGIAVEGGIKMHLFAKSKISPSLSGHYFSGTSNVQVLRGNASSSTGALQGAEISESGFLIGAGLRIRLM
jgi:hypothetical protein